jgi:hypothetical protein
MSAVRTPRPPAIRPLTRPAPLVLVLARLTPLALVFGCALLVAMPPAAHAGVTTTSVPGAGGETAAGGAAEGSTLESAASKAGSTGRKVAMSLIGLAFSVAAIVLAFRRDFKEAVGVFAVGIVAVLLATSSGIHLLQDTVNSLFGS